MLTPSSFCNVIDIGLNFATYPPDIKSTSLLTLSLKFISTNLCPFTSSFQQTWLPVNCMTATQTGNLLCLLYHVHQVAYAFACGVFTVPRLVCSFLLVGHILCPAW